MTRSAVVPDAQTERVTVRRKLRVVGQEACHHLEDRLVVGAADLMDDGAGLRNGADQPERRCADRSPTRRDAPDPASLDLTYPFGGRPGRVDRQRGPLA